MEITKIVALAANLLIAMASDDGQAFVQVNMHHQDKAMKLGKTKATYHWEATEQTMGDETTKIRSGLPDGDQYWKPSSMTDDDFLSDCQTRCSSPIDGHACAGFCVMSTRAFFFTSSDNLVTGKPSWTFHKKTLGGWAMSSAGATCDVTCAVTGRVCNNARQGGLTSNELVGAAFAEAGYTCKSFHGARDYQGAPFSTGRDNDDCAPFWDRGREESSCDRNFITRHDPLCYCDVVNYEEVSAGTCTSNGLVDITDVTECLAAGQTIRAGIGYWHKMPSTGWTQDFGAGRMTGCSIQDSHSNLDFFTYANTGTCDIGHGGGTFHCICKKIE